MTALCSFHRLPPQPPSFLEMTAPDQELVILLPSNKESEQITAAGWRACRKTNLIAQSDRDLASGSFFDSESLSLSVSPAGRSCLCSARPLQTSADYV